MKYSNSIIGERNRDIVNAITSAAKSKGIPIDNSIRNVVLQKKIDLVTNTQNFGYELNQNGTENFAPDTVKGSSLFIITGVSFHIVATSTDCTFPNPIFLGTPSNVAEIRKIYDTGNLILLQNSNTIHNIPLSRFLNVPEQPGNGTSVGGTTFVQVPQSFDLEQNFIPLAMPLACSATSAMSTEVRLTTAISAALSAYTFQGVNNIAPAVKLVISIAGIEIENQRDVLKSRQWEKTARGGAFWSELSKNFIQT